MRDIKLQVVPGHKINPGNQTEMLQAVDVESRIPKATSGSSVTAIPVSTATPTVTLNKELNFSHEVKQKLYELQNKGIDINQLLLEFLEKRETEIAEEKEKLSQEIQEIQKVRLNSGNPGASRYIPVKIKNLLKKEHGTKCSIETCQKPSEEIHHTQRFGLTKTHDPHFLAPCSYD